ncbi:MAG: SusC/RagA family TonB-linked outer membrane protein [Polaribacter sp.]
MIKKYSLLFYLFSLITTSLCAQNIITGVVKDKTGELLPSVSVVIKNTTKGTVTDFDGKFSLKVKLSNRLLFSSIGYKTQEIVISDYKDLNIVMQESSFQLNEIVVTALGIKKEKKALGYAVQDVKGESINKAKETNFIKSLTGKVAGLTIQNSTDLFQDAVVKLRGEKPLIVIDGIPDRTADIWKINSDNIQSISVLKGTTASALYGSIGKYGALMIITKKGKKGKVSISINSSSIFQTSFIRSPEVQTVYGNGNQGNYSYIDGSGSAAEGGGWIWGPKLDQKDASTPSGFVEKTQYNSPTDKNGNLIPLPFISRGKNNIKNFFRVGHIYSNSIGINWGSDKANVRFSAADISQEGIVPNASLDNSSFSLNASTNLSEKIKVSGGLTYNTQYTDNFPSVGYGPTNYLYNLALWTGIDVDIRDLRDYWKKGKKGYQQKHFNTSFYNNPYFQAYEYLRGYDKKTIFGNFNASYKIISGLTLKGRIGMNNYNLYRTHKEPKSYIGYGKISRGNFTILTDNYLDITSAIGLEYQKKITQNFSIKSQIGLESFYSKYIKGKQSTDGLNMPGFYNLSNNAGSSILASNYQEKQGINSIYGYIDLNFYDIYYLTLTGRNDVVSTLKAGNNSYFYPSISGSIILSKLIQMPDFISFAKLRGSWAQVSDGKINADPYGYISGYQQGTIWNGHSSVNSDDTYISEQITPESTANWEIGTNIKLFKNRLGLDIAYYRARDYNNIIDSPSSESSGYSSFRLNGDEFRREGLEFVVNVSPIKKELFKWNISINASTNKRIQTKIFDNKKKTARNIKVGERTDAIYTDVYKTDSKGNVIFKNGLPLSDPYPRYIGNGNSNWVFGISNNITYKNLDLSFSFDGRSGGVIYSTTNQKMWWGGTHLGTVNQFRDDAFNGKKTFIGNGVIVTSGEAKYDVDGNIILDTRTYKKNDVAVNYINYMQKTSNKINTNYQYYSQSFIKLREVSLTYNFNKEIMKKTFLKDASISLVGRNLFLFANVSNIDPDSGIDKLQTPSTRNFGINVKLKF